MRRASILAVTACVAACAVGGCRLFIGVPKTGWELVGSKAFTAGSNWSGDVVVRTMADGNPAVAYTEMKSGASTSLYVQRWTGSAWVMAGANPVTTAFVGAGGSSGLMMTADAQGKLLVGYSEWASTVFRAARFDGSSWAVAASVDLGAANAQVQDMAVDAAGTIWLVAQSGSSPSCGHALYKQSGTSFILAATDPASYDYATDLHLAIAPGGTDYVSFSTHSSSGVSSLSVTTYDGAAWTGIGPNLPAAQNPAKVAFDTAGTPCIVFSAESANSFFDPVVMRYTGSGTAWAAIGTGPISSACQASDYALEMHGDIPFVALEENLGYNEISVFCCDSGTWTPVGRRGFSDGRAGEMPSLTLDANGVPSVALIEVGNSEKISVYRYAGNEN